MTLNQLYYFQKVASLQHYRLAAVELNISQPSLSRSMNALEEELNCVLFRHVGRNIELTEYGIIFLEHVCKILDEVGSATHKMQQLSSGFGQIDIAYVYPLSTKFIPLTVRKFLSENEDKEINFTFTQSFTNHMIDGLKKRNFDVVFCSKLKDDSDIEYFPIHTSKLVMITPLNHPLCHSKSVSITALNDFPVIGYDQFSGLGEELASVYKKHNLNPTIICHSPDENSIVSLVEEDFGIALVSDIPLLHESENIHIIPLKDETITHTIYMAYLKDNHRILAVRNFIKYIKRECENFIF